MATGPIINEAICSGCGSCTQICPMAIFTMDTSSVPHHATVIPERAEHCMGCGHCMAICDTRAVQVKGLDYERDFFEIEPMDNEFDSLMHLLNSRRSVRAYKNKPVPMPVLTNIVEAISTAPMGFTPHKVEIAVVPDRTTIEAALPIIIKTYEKLDHLLSNPFIRPFMKRAMSAEQYNSLQSHVLPTLSYRLPDMQAGKYDTLTRGAPAMLLFHAHKGAIHHQEDAYIALSYGLIAAHAHGLGACAIGLVPPIVQRSTELRDMFKIPSQHDVIACMVLGYAKYTYKRGIKREMASVHQV